MTMTHLIKHFALLLTLLLCISSLSLAQNYDNRHPESENLKVPGDWKIRLDNPDKEVSIGSDPDQSDIYFVNMTPGWHITTGPRAIFYKPEVVAEGSYRVSTKIHLFDPKGRNEAFGLFIGGQNLQQDNQSYTYFLLRNSGEYLIKRRIGSDTKVVVDWTNAPMMVQYKDTAKSSVANTLSISVNDENARFWVNGQKVHTLPKSQLDTEGIVGLRVNHRLNLHIEELNVKR